MEYSTDPFIYRPTAQVVQTPQHSDGKLAGMRLAVKDLFHVAGINTTAGNPDWAQSHETPTETNSVIKTLLSHGAIFVGKTLTDELAYSLNGQNQHYGTPINIKAPERLPGGSSSGSAVAVAMQQAEIGLGTDTGGSIRVPASYNGLFGLRPTHGAIATDNMVCLAPRFDTVGWITKDLNHLNKVAEVLLPETTLAKPGKITVLQSLLDLVSHGKAISQFVQKSSCATENACFDETLLSEASEAFKVLQGREIWQQHGEWITEINPNFAPDIKQRLNWCSTLTAAQQKAAEIQASKVNQVMSSLLANNNIILLPTTPGPAPLLNTPAEDLVHYRDYLLGLTALAGLSGLPQLHIPLPSENSAPSGFSLLGPKHSELTLIKLAQTLTGENA